MFRELTRKAKQISNEECTKILITETRGVLSVIGDSGYPYGMPMNHFYNEADGNIYFHCGKEGHRIDALKRCDKVSFCVYDKGYRKEGEWTYNVKSVIVFGKTEIIDEIEKINDITAKLSRKFTDDEAYISREIKAFSAKTLLIKLTPEHICGKLVNES